MNGDLLNTPLTEQHIALGARMVPFGGWNMPVQYQEGILAEHEHTRTQVSLFDICHMGEFRIKGEGATAAVDHLLARGICDLKIGACRYNFLMTPEGTVIDDLIVYRVAEDELFIVVNAGTRAGDAEHFKAHLPTGIEFTDESDETAKLDLQGPKSADVLANLGFEAPTLPKYFNWMMTRVAGIPCLLSRTGYTGELGFEFYFAADKAVEFWNLLLDQPGVKPAGLGARDTLRLEMGYPLYGHELNTKTTPVEAGFGPMLKLDSDRTFTGCNVLHSDHAKKKLIGVELDGRRAAREGAAVFSGDEQVGTVSSGAFSPSLGKSVAMAYVSAKAGIEVGAKLLLDAGRTKLDGTVVELPFYREGTVRKKI